MEQLNQPVAWVVGGSRGLGFALARQLVRMGYRVTLFARDPQALTSAAAALQSAAGDRPSVPIATAVMDACQGSQVETVFREQYAAAGRLDLLINAVGQSCRGSVWQPDLTQYRQMMDVNFFSVVNTSLTALPWLAESHGSLVNIATLAAKTPWSWIAPYGASKAAVANFTDNVRLESDGRLHVLLVCPGPIHRADAGVRYQQQAADLAAAAAQPGAGAPLKSLEPERLAQEILQAIKRKRPLLIRPAKAYWLFLAQAISSRFGAWLARRLQRRP
jgi:short-subunit dehydrogenase